MSNEKPKETEETLNGCPSPTDKSNSGGRSKSPVNQILEFRINSDSPLLRLGRVRPSSWDDSDDEVVPPSTNSEPQKTRIYSCHSKNSRGSVISEINEIKVQFFQFINNEAKIGKEPKNTEKENEESLLKAHNTGNMTDTVETRSNFDGKDRRQSPARIRRRTRSSSSSSPVAEAKNQHNNSPEVAEECEAPEKDEELDDNSAFESEDVSPKKELDLAYGIFPDDFFTLLRRRRIGLVTTEDTLDGAGPIENIFRFNSPEGNETDLPSDSQRKGKRHSNFLDVDPLDSFVYEAESFHHRTFRKLSKILEVEEVRRDLDECKSNSSQELVGGPTRESEVFETVPYFTKIQRELQDPTPAPASSESNKTSDDGEKNFEKEKETDSAEEQLLGNEKEEKLTLETPGSASQRSSSSEKVTNLEKSGKNSKSFISKKYFLGDTSSENIISLTAKSGNIKISSPKESARVRESPEKCPASCPVAGSSGTTKDAANGKEQPKLDDLEQPKPRDSHESLRKDNLIKDSTPRKSHENTCRSAKSSEKVKSEKSSESAIKLNPKSPKFRINVARDSSRSLKREEIKNSGSEVRAAEEEEETERNSTATEEGKLSSSEDSTPRKSQSNRRWEKYFVTEGNLRIAIESPTLESRRSTSRSLKVEEMTLDRLQATSGRSSSRGTEKSLGRWMSTEENSMAQRIKGEDTPSSSCNSFRVCPDDVEISNTPVHNESPRRLQQSTQNSKRSEAKHSKDGSYKRVIKSGGRSVRRPETPTVKTSRNAKLQKTSSRSWECRQHSESFDGEAKTPETPKDESLQGRLHLPISSRHVGRLRGLQSCTSVLERRKADFPSEITLATPTTSKSENLKRVRSNDPNPKAICEGFESITRIPIQKLSSRSCPAVKIVSDDFSKCKFLSKRDRNSERNLSTSSRSSKSQISSIVPNDMTPRSLKVEEVRLPSQENTYRSSGGSSRYDHNVEKCKSTERSLAELQIPNLRTQRSSCEERTKNAPEDDVSWRSTSRRSETKTEKSQTDKSAKKDEQRTLEKEKLKRSKTVRSEGPPSGTTGKQQTRRSTCKSEVASTSQRSSTSVIKEPTFHDPEKMKLVLSDRKKSFKCKSRSLSEVGSDRISLPSIATSDVSDESNLSDNSENSTTVEIEMDDHPKPRTQRNEKKSGTPVGSKATPEALSSNLDESTGKPKTNFDEEMWNNLIETFDVSDGSRKSSSSEENFSASSLKKASGSSSSERELPAAPIEDGRQNEFFKNQKETDECTSATSERLTAMDKKLWVLKSSRRKYSSEGHPEQKNCDDTKVPHLEKPTKLPAEDSTSLRKILKDEDNSIQLSKNVFYFDLGNENNFGIGEFGDITCWNVEQWRLPGSNYKDEHFSFPLPHPLTLDGTGKPNYAEAEKPKDHGDGNPEPSDNWDSFGLKPQSRTKELETQKHLWKELTVEFANSKPLMNKRFLKEDCDVNLFKYVSKHNLKTSKSDNAVNQKVTDSKELKVFSARTSEYVKIGENVGNLTINGKNSSVALSKSSSAESIKLVEKMTKSPTIDSRRIRKLNSSMSNIEILLEKIKSEKTKLNESINESEMKLFDQTVKSKIEKECTNLNIFLARKKEEEIDAKTNNWLVKNPERKKWQMPKAKSRRLKLKMKKRGKNENTSLSKEFLYVDEKEGSDIRWNQTSVPLLKLRHSSNCLQNFYKRMISVFCLTSNSSASTSN